MSDFDPYHKWLGIPPQEQPANHYRLLAITDFEVDREVISAAAERQTIYLRTMQAGEHEVLVAELLNEVSQARVTLLNADQKAAYDEELRKQQTPEPQPEPTPRAIPVVQTTAPTPVVVRGTVTQDFPVSVVQPTRKPRRRKPKEIWKQPAVIGISVVVAIGVLVLFISQMSPGDAEPVASNTPGRLFAEMAVETAAAEKADAEKAVTVTTALVKGDWKEVLALDPGNIEGLRLQDAAEVQAAEVQAAEEQAAEEQAAEEKAAAEKAAAEKAAAEKAAAERATADKAAADKAAADKAAAVTAALGKRDWKTVLAIDADNIEGKQMQAADLEIIARAPIANRIGMKLKLIPAGTFMMGSPETEKNRGDGEHQHEVTISKAFYIQTTEVTQRQWRAVMGTEPWKGQELSKYVKEGPNYPVAYISWDAAVAYCKILSQAVGKTYRLPTEAEWEYACRAGTPTAWSFGDDEKALGDYAWYKENASDIVSEQYAHQVGLKKPNAFGLYDMHGNVYEWCHDYYGGEYYKQSPEKDPTGPTSGSFPVLRGGAWLASTRDTRSARRDRGGAGGRRDSYGFRLVRELD
jgi:sulfatase modifying factor 1